MDYRWMHKVLENNIFALKSKMDALGKRRNLGDGETLNYQKMTHQPIVNISRDLKTKRNPSLSPLLITLQNYGCVPPFRTRETRKLAHKRNPPSIDPPLLRIYEPTRLSASKLATASGALRRMSDVPVSCGMMDRPIPANMQYCARSVANWYPCIKSALDGKRAVWARLQDAA